MIPLTNCKNRYILIKQTVITIYEKNKEWEIKNNEGKVQFLAKNKETKFVQQTQICKSLYLGNLTV